MCLNYIYTNSLIPILLIKICILAHLTNFHLIYDAVHLVFTNYVALLIELIPLEAGITVTPGISIEILAYLGNVGHFLSQTLNGSKDKNYKIRININAKWHNYERYRALFWWFREQILPGDLYDDMRLGKVLQSICIITSGSYHKA